VSLRLHSRIIQWHRFEMPGQPAAILSAARAQAWKSITRLPHRDKQITDNPRQHPPARQIAHIRTFPWPALLAATALPF
jgi:hypothetical protein